MSLMGTNLGGSTGRQSVISIMSISREVFIIVAELSIGGKGATVSTMIERESTSSFTVHLSSMLRFVYFTFTP